MQRRDAGFAAPGAIAHERYNRVPDPFGLLCRSSIADLRSRPLRGPLAFCAFRPVPDVKLALADNKKPDGQQR